MGRLHDQAALDAVITGGVVKSGKIISYIRLRSETLCRGNLLAAKGVLENMCFPIPTALWILGI